MGSVLIKECINKAANHIVEDLAWNDVSVSLAGTIVLKNIRIRPSFLNNLRLPVTTTAATVGRISLKVSVELLETPPEYPFLVECCCTLSKDNPGDDLSKKENFTFFLTTGKPGKAEIGYFYRKCHFSGRLFNCSN